MAKRVKVKESEKLDDNNVKYVIELLESDKPITKKEACGILRISYNTTRLGNIIAGYKERAATDARLRAKNRGRAATDGEIVRAIEEYLNGDAISEIAKYMYRSSSFIKGIIKRFNVPVRSSSVDYFHPELLPDAVLSESFKPGELVWSARYNTTAVVDKLDEKLHPIHGNCYRIWLKGKDSKFAYQPWYELGKLEHLQNLGVKLHGQGSFPN
jgi:hypothetical protein